MSDKNKEEVEIDLLALGKKLWDNKKFILKCSVIGAIVGIVIAFSIPKEYTSTVIFTTNSSKQSGGNMSALASMAGINLGGAMGDETLSPELYPEVLNSTPFIQELLNINVSNNGINTTLYNYLKNDQKSPWWNYIIGAPRALINLLFSDEQNQNIEVDRSKRSIPQEEMKLIEKFKNSYAINADRKTGIITLNASAQSPQIAAYLADTLTSYLQSYIIEQRTKKASTDLINSKKLYKQSKEKYYETQQQLASFADANINLISAKYKINQEKLQNEATLAYSVYNQMAQQVQMNKIKVQNETPVFIIIQPAIEPLYPEKPNKKIIIIASLFFTISIACGWILGRDYLEILNKK